MAEAPDDRIPIRRALLSVADKTGLIGFTRTLSGYVTDDGGRELVFSVMLNNYTADKPITWIDRMVTLIATGGKSR